MTDDELREIAWEFRCGLWGESASVEGLCFATSEPLAGYLRSLHKMDVQVVVSDHSESDNSEYYEHAWIKLPDGRVLDPTFDQFCSEDHVPIYIGPPTEFHLL